ncbi:MAG: TRAP transporter large permease subunit [Rhodobacteraceae bacterium]|jgi:TRAP-type mannitol/chloroaromatic compound transport system permease large subunit|nr:TRAP transporter large permease subunit [Paracoccaceae bacterium]MBT6298932.1 TRAP transporter large permease subunit [Paracoccaceae bacterium]MDE2632284.1 TRAP transporter large permease subunit [Paracoccaceae bacterium]HBR61453.1 C4-dicarboxylate ABC transporter permease [Paracoccaceae bacterium]|tara:strand:+ start:3330 stop:4994 length:1665 start_codon:yes stop_codon:yes gene_type:complete
MDIGTISLLLLLGLFFLLAIGMPLGLASAILAVFVLVMKFEPALLSNPLSFGCPDWYTEANPGARCILTGRPGAGPLNILQQKIYGVLTSYVLISVPLFIFMASLLEKSGIAKDMYASLNVWLSRTRGGIAIVTSIMAVIMAAMSGIIGGEVVLLGLIALPQMLKLGYNQNLAIGTICASGSLGTMIPPSIVLIMYGLITETSIKALFTAAFLPGFMLASFFIIYIIIRTQLRPEDAPLPDPEPGEPEGREKSVLFATFLTILVAGFSSVLFLRVLFFTVTGQNADLGDTVDPIVWGTPDYVIWFAASTGIALLLLFFIFGLERTKLAWSMGKGLVPPIVVIGVVLGSIYGGITGITEAAGMGAVAVLIIATLRGEANFELIWDSLMRTMKSTGTIIWVTMGAAALAGAYTIAGGPRFVADLIVGSEMPTMFVLLSMMFILLIMGAFMDWVGIVLLIIPVFLPIVMRLPIEEIGVFGQLEPRHVATWFGVLFCMNMQVSFLSPPFGPAAFYLKSVAPPHISLTDIFKGFLPFIGIQLVALTVLLLWPSIITVLL